VLLATHDSSRMADPEEAGSSAAYSITVVCSSSSSCLWCMGCWW
jgi:hypothetical protein